MTVNETPVGDDPEIYDVLIVGAGPAGLAVAARLREETPAAIFTDEEHRRYRWLRKHGGRVSLKQVKTGRERRAVRTAAAAGQPDEGGPHMLVVDASAGQWLGRWQRLFRAFGISHLRSPLLWHIDPQDRDSLLARAHLVGGPEDLFDIGACVGKEISKHLKKKRSNRRGGLQEAQAHVDINERERNDYFTPSSGLFQDHCHSVAARYGLAGAVRQETVVDIDWGVVAGRGGDGPDGSDSDKLFTVTTDRGRRYARVVVLAVGPANTARLPSIPGLSAAAAAAAAAGLSDGRCPQMCHAFESTRVPDGVLAARIAAGRATEVLVVGGGLTAAQIGDLLLRRGVRRVWQLMRGREVVKYFDVDLGWMGKYRNREQARFWSADSDAERMVLIREARGGGSVTPHYHRILRRHVATGSVQLRTQTRVTGLAFDAAAGTWRVTADPPVPEMPAVDHVYFATGITTDVQTLPWLQTLQARKPIDTVDGLPCLTEDLAWADDVPLFCAGRLAMLRIGPAAPNIGGCKLAAERIGLAVDAVLRRQRGEAVAADAGADYASGVGSKYQCLGSE